MIQLNAMLSKGVLDLRYYTNATKAHRPVSATVCRDSRVVRTERHDHCCTYEKAGILIAQHINSSLLSGNYVCLVGDEAYEVVRLDHFYSMAYGKIAELCLCMKECMFLHIVK